MQNAFSLGGKSHMILIAKTILGNKVNAITLNSDFLSLILLIIWFVLLKIVNPKQEAFKYL